jgi:hypothetical protein
VSGEISPIAELAEIEEKHDVVPTSLPKKMLGQFKGGRRMLMLEAGGELLYRL